MPRTLAIGDIHGCDVAFKTLLDFVSLCDDDLIITLGDYPDRGSNTKGVIDRLISLSASHQLVPLRGNHDIMMLDARNGHEEFHNWVMVGGDQALESYAAVKSDPGSLEDIPESHWGFLNDSLLPYFETETHFFVHANAYPEIPLDEQPDFMLYWESFDHPARHQSGKIMVCGHTSQKSGLPLVTDDAVCIDTWAHGDGWLSCLHVETGVLKQANRQGQTREFWLDELPEG